MTRGAPRPVLVTGGAGFIGTNLAHRLLATGESVTVFDNLSRAGVERNLRWLQRTHGARVHVLIADVRDRRALGAAVANASAVFHLAGQVAVTTSLADPLDDFDVNARGTLQLLEALRALPAPPPLVVTSTNKVYGSLADVPLDAGRRRYRPLDPALAARGVDERRPLAFHSPYGCSKGAADQYSLDYARTFGLPAVVFRMSCIYGPHQFGTEDQGWLAHFLLRAIAGQPITLYGDGRQVRDALFVDDLVDALLLARAAAARLGGRAFNIGGGPTHTVSLLELVELIGELCGRTPDVRVASWRPADQRYYVSDTSAFTAVTGWTARIGLPEGLARLYRWLLEARAPAPPTKRAAPATAARLRAGRGRQGRAATWRQR